MMHETCWHLDTTGAEGHSIIQTERRSQGTSETSQTSFYETTLIALRIRLAIEKHANAEYSKLLLQSSEMVMLYASFEHSKLFHAHLH